MNRRLLQGLLLLTPGLVGCTPDGPVEFYRAALQARSEFVDSLSRVVDDKTAKDKFDKSEKLMGERLREIKEGLDKAKYDNSFRKLSRDNFDLKRLEADDRDGMILGIRSYAAYCKNIVATNIRFKREMNRLKMVNNIEILERVRNQIANNQPVDAGEPPNLSMMFEKLKQMNDINLRFVPEGVTVDHLKKLDAGIEDSLLELVVTFVPSNLDVKDKDFSPPTLPDYPAWALDVARRAKLEHLTKK